MDNEDGQLEFDFGPTPCKCTENTRYDDLCPACLQECLEWMSAQNKDDGWEEHA